MIEIPQNSTVYAVTMLFAGIGIPIMAALNAGLGTKLQSPALAAAILFLVAMAASLSYLLLVEGIPTIVLGTLDAVLLLSGRLVRRLLCAECDLDRSPLWYRQCRFLCAA